MNASMELNADFSKRVLVRSTRLPWQASPAVGVERRMLDRIGGEVARATTIVRYRARSRFEPHVHGGGEEFLVLEGVFQDEEGDYPAGTYVRNPPGSSHAPRSDIGCTIFVKLRQFDPEDQVFVRKRIDPTPGGATSQIVLFERHDEIVSIETLEAGAQLAVDGALGAEILVLEGAITQSHETLGAHDWLRTPPGGALEFAAGPSGARLWLKRGGRHGAA